MGKGRTRKPGDQPKVRIAGLNVAKAGVVMQASNDECPAIINAKLNETPLTKNGVSIDLKRNGERYDMFIAGTLIGTLDLRLSKRISRCSEFGIKYKGTISIMKNEVYGKFKRQT